MKDRAISQAIKERIDAAGHITLASHIRPDGDAVGSVIGLGLALREYGKQVHLSFEETLPKRFRFLEAGLEKDESNKDTLYIALDCADQQRLAHFFADKQIAINIDHHATNDAFAALNYVDEDAAATTEIITNLLTEWQMQISPSAANALLMGIITDTIGFRTPNTTPQTLHAASLLMEKGADLSTTYQQSLTDMNWEASLLWGNALAKLQKEDNIIYTDITCEDRKKAGFTGRDDADLTNFLSSIQDAEITILFNQQDENTVKVSWRSRSDVNVSVLASQFGGGGHPAAAGAEIKLSLPQTQQKILQATKEFLIKYHD